MRRSDRDRLRGSKPSKLAIFAIAIMLTWISWGLFVAALMNPVTAWAYAVMLCLVWLLAMPLIR